MQVATFCDKQAGNAVADAGRITGDERGMPLEIEFHGAS